MAATPKPAAGPKLDPAVHVWRATSGGNLKRCSECKFRSTTAVVKNVMTGKTKPLCGVCAKLSGLTQ